MKKTIVIFTAIAITMDAAAQNILLPATKVTVKVVNENNQPIENAKVSLGFGNTSVQGVTDSEGLFTGEGHCGAAGMGTMITKDGYYWGSAPIPKFTKHDDILNRWEPWNKTYTAILRPLGKPVALYAKVVQTEIPDLDKPCGYDLEVGDWVTPYGKGFKSDFIFNIHRDYKDWFNFSAEGEIRFKQVDDGLFPMTSPPVAQNSSFRWERFASESGYIDSFKIYLKTTKQGEHQKWESNKGNDGYFFRVRTVKQNNQIVSAHYGKLVGDIGIDPRSSKTCTVMFTYYFNPTPNDRNLEWDTKKNLFGGLTAMESPREP